MLSDSFSNALIMPAPFTAGGAGNTARHRPDIPVHAWPGRPGRHRPRRHRAIHRLRTPESRWRAKDKSERAGAALKLRRLFLIGCDRWV
jgi:hypothetical protein